MVIPLTAFTTLGKNAQEIDFSFPFCPVYSSKKKKKKKKKNPQKSSLYLYSVACVLAGLPRWC